MSHPFTNHLIGEKSPYLQQHAHNPVDWYPWGEEAFDLAKELDKPIFLSIGYATCHWCHVMEHESFANTELAKMMNETFVNIKVDREERPEIDNLYMEFAQALMATGGGWPLNVILTPSLKPFFAVTYLPPKTRRGMIGLDQFIYQIKQLWQSDERPFIIEQADHIVEIFEKAAYTMGSEIPFEELIDIASLQLFEAADAINGGLKGEPKFPFGYQSIFLLMLAKQKGEGRALFLAELTLDKMANGGIYDHLGGGFSRYTVDEKWQIPHFEKMLIDNAILAKTYIEGWRLLKKERYVQIAKETLDYLLNDMLGNEGAGYSAEDADSEGHEGLFYTWTLKEIEALLPPQLSLLFCAFYGVTEGGNFDGRSILHSDISLEKFAEMQNLSEVELDKRLKEARHILFEKRKERTRPFRDDKILSGWNGLMIDALVHAGKAFEEEKYCQAAIKAATFLKENLWKEGHLMRRYREGEARFEASLEDYAYLIKGVLSLFEAGYGISWFEWAAQLAAILETRFKAPKGAYYQTDLSVPIILRKCNFYDGAEPSGNAVHTENLLRLYQITQEEHYLTSAEDILKAAKKFIETYSVGSCYHLLALQYYYNKQATTFIIALDKEASLSDIFVKNFYKTFAPHNRVIWKKEEDSIDRVIPYLADKTTIEGKTAIYCCQQNMCRDPIVTAEVLLKEIE